MSKYALLLCSGGLDSTACIQYYQDLGYTINPLFIRFGHPAESYELKSARKVCTHFGLNLKDVGIETRESRIKSGELVGRNLMLISNALFHIEENTVIVIGVHSGTQYYDCSFGFINKLNDLINEMTNGVVRLEAPFVDWQKHQIWEYCKIKNVPTELTYSCEKGVLPRCGKCETCIDFNLLL